jgi:integrase
MSSPQKRTNWFSSALVPLVVLRVVAAGLVVSAGAGVLLGPSFFCRHTTDPRVVAADLLVIQRLLGHSNITTTRYLHLSDADLLAGVDQAIPAA